MDDKESSSQTHNTAVDTLYHAEAHGAAPAFVQVFGEYWKPVAIVIGTVVILLSLVISAIGVGVAAWAAITTTVSNKALEQRMGDKLDEANVNLRQMWYWAGQVYAEVHAKGINIPPPPQPKGMTHERSRRRDQ